MAENCCWYVLMRGEETSADCSSSLDEAQNIKNRKTKAAKAAVALKAKYRWCLTGTPIQVRTPCFATMTC